MAAGHSSDFFFGAELWTWSADLKHQLDTVTVRMLRFMLRLPRKPPEAAWWSWNRDSLRLARDKMFQLGSGASLADKALLRCVCVWKRLRVLPAESYVGRLLCWRSAADAAFDRDLFTATGLASEGAWRRRRRGRPPRRWEAALVSAWSPTWFGRPVWELHPAALLAELDTG